MTAVDVHTRDAEAPVKPEPASWQNFKTALARYTPTLESRLPQGVDPGAMITDALVAAQANPELLQCTPSSIAVSLVRVAQLGLQVGTTAHLVPFNVNTAPKGQPPKWEKRCQMVPGYQGYVELITDAGARKVEAYAVREGEEFHYELGLNPILVHRPTLGSTAPVVAAYAIVTLRGGEKQLEIMTGAEIDDIRQRLSKQWKKGDLPDWYARKTVIRRVAKYVPKTRKLAALLAADGEVPEGQFETLEPTPEQVAAIPDQHPRRQLRAVPDANDSYGRPANVDEDGVVDAELDAEILEAEAEPGDAVEG